jgi:hypothetical protein
MKQTCFYRYKKREKKIFFDLLCAHTLFEFEKRL